MSRTDDQRLRDIVESIDAIDRADTLPREHPQDTDVEQVALDAIHYRVFTIGEAAQALSSALRDAHPKVPWSDIARTRDLIGHHYYKLDPQIVRATIGEPVARLRAACAAILAGSSAPADETDYLFSNPANAKRLLSSIERLEANVEPKPDQPDCPPRTRHRGSTSDDEPMTGGRLLLHFVNGKVAVTAPRSLPLASAPSNRRRRLPGGRWADVALRPWGDATTMRFSLPRGDWCTQRIAQAGTSTLISRSDWRSVCSSVTLRGCPPAAAGYRRPRQLSRQSVTVPRKRRGCNGTPGGTRLWGRCASRTMRRGLPTSPPGGPRRPSSPWSGGRSSRRSSPRTSTTPSAGAVTATTGIVGNSASSTRTRASTASTLEPRGTRSYFGGRSETNALATVFREIPNLRAIPACETPSDRCSRRISAQFSTVITLQAVLGVLKIHPSTTAQFSRVVDTSDTEQLSTVRLPSKGPHLPR